MNTEDYLKLTPWQRRSANLFLINAGFKFCLHCSRILPLDQFDKCHGRLGNRQTYCTQCRRVRHFAKKGMAAPPIISFDAQDPVNNKVCHKCKRELPKTEFHQEKRSPDGFQRWCKACGKEHAKSYAERRLECARKRYPITRIRANERQKERRKEDPIFREKAIKNCKQWRVENPDKKRLYDRRYYVFKSLTDPVYNIKRNLRGSFKKFIKNKQNSVFHYLGCSADEFKSHIASQFIKGMSWDNHGRKTWHLDHIVPEHIFNPFDDEEVKLCWNYRNFQPLEAEINCGSKRESLFIAKEHLLRKIEKFGSDEFYERLLKFLEYKLSSPNQIPD